MKIKTRFMAIKCIPTIKIVRPNPQVHCQRFEMKVPAQPRKRSSGKFLDN